MRMLLEWPRRGSRAGRGVHPSPRAHGRQDARTADEPSDEPGPTARAVDEGDERPRVDYEAEEPDDLARSAAHGGHLSAQTTATATVVRHTAVTAVAHGTTVSP